MKSLAEDKNICDIFFDQKIKCLIVSVNVI